MKHRQSIAAAVSMSLRSSIVIALMVILTAGCGASKDSNDSDENSPVQGEWQLVREAQDDGYYYLGLYFLDEDNGWVVGTSGRILHSRDSGDSWEVQNSGIASDLKCVYFANSEKGWIGGSNNTIGSTKDGGTSWTWQHPAGEPRRTFMAMSFLDEQTGWTVDNFGGILHTQDGGATWIAQDSGTQYPLDPVQFIDTNIGWALDRDGRLLRTTNGGESWTTNESFCAGAYSDMFFIDGNNGWISTTTLNPLTSSMVVDPLVDPVPPSALLRTTDGGETWFTQAELPGTWFPAISFADQEVGWVAGEGAIACTQNGGNSWSLDLDKPLGIFEDIAVVDRSHAWILGFTGTVYRYQAT